MSDSMPQSEPFLVMGKIDMPYKYSVGRVGSKFLTELRDSKRILGMKCSTCNQVYVPPKSTCPKCFSRLDEWVEVGNQGTLLSYTIVRYRGEIHPLELPFAYGIIQLDGADTGFVHLLGEVDLEAIRIGMRLEAVFREERSGSILDIKYFRPAG